jgi:hypothetical protein
MREALGPGVRSKGTPLRAVHRYGNGTAARAGLVVLCCFLGSKYELVYPQLGAAILFPPYAVLTAALVFSPVRRWWGYGREGVFRRSRRTNQPGQ